MPNATIDVATATATNGNQQAPASKKKSRKAKIRSVGDSSENGELQQQQQLSEQEQQVVSGGETRISSPSPSSPKTEENGGPDATNKNPYLEVISKRLKTEKKRLAKIEKAEETLKEPDGKSKLNEDQLRNLEKKTEVLAAIKTFESILTSLASVEAEEQKAQKKRQKAEQTEKDQAIVEAVRAAEDAFTESTIALLQFFRLDHYRQRGIAHLVYDQVEAVEKFRSLVTILVDSAGDEEERRKQTKQVLQHIEKLKTGSDEVINARTGQIINGEDLQLSGITYGDLLSLAQNPPIFEQGEMMSPEMGKYSPYMTDHDEISTDASALRFTTDVQIPSELIHDQEQSLPINSAETSHPPEMEEITPVRTEPSSAIDEHLSNEAEATLQQLTGSYELNQYGAEHQQVDQFAPNEQQVRPITAAEIEVVSEQRQQQEVQFETMLAVDQEQQVEHQGPPTTEGASDDAEVQVGDTVQQAMLPVGGGPASLPPRPPNQPSGPHSRQNSYHGQFPQGGYNNFRGGHRGGNNFRARGYRNQGGGGGGGGGSGPNRRDSFGRGGGGYRGYDHNKNGGFRGGRGNPNGRGGNANFQQGPRGNPGFRNRGNGQQQ